MYTYIYIYLDSAGGSICNTERAQFATHRMTLYWLNLQHREGSIAAVNGHLSSATMPAWLAEGVLGLHALAWNHGSNSSHCRSGLLSCPSCPWSPRLWPQHHVCPAPLLWKLPLWCSCCMLPHQTIHNPHMHSSGKCSNSWCCFCAIHSWQPLFQHAHVLWRQPRLVVSQGIAYEIVLLHHAPLVSTSSTAALSPSSSSLPACQRSKRKDKHEMLGLPESSKMTSDPFWVCLSHIRVWYLLIFTHLSKYSCPKLVSQNHLDISLADF